WEMALGKHIEGQAKLEHGLQLSLEHNLHFSAARTMSNLGNELKSLRDYSASLHYVEMGLEYSNQHDLDQWFVDFLTDRAYIRFQQGYWTEAHQDIQTILKLRDERETIEIFGIHSLLVQMQARRGDSFSPEVLDVVRKSAAEIEELDYRCRYAAFFAELAWLRDDLAQSRAEAEPTFQIVSQISVHPYPLIGFSELSYWMWRVGVIDKAPPLVMEPYATQIAGNWREAASLWEKFGCPYEQGMALMDGDVSAQLAALEIFERLGARPIIHKL